MDLSKFSSTLEIGRQHAVADVSACPAAETLEQLLAADDLPTALKQLAGRFDHALVALVWANADAARDGGEIELAESLVDLAEYIEQALAATSPAVSESAPQAPPAKPADLRETGLQDEQVEPVRTPYHPAIDALLKPGAEAGENVKQARLELQTPQFLLRDWRRDELARPSEARREQEPKHQADLAPQVEPVEVSIIILTFNNLALTSQCLASIHAYTLPGLYEIIVVDNGSTDDTVPFLRQYATLRPEVRVIINNTNRGFAGGNNQGLTLARGRYVLFLNNDTVVTPGWLLRLLSVMERYPEVGLAGPMSNNTVGPQWVRDVPYRNQEEMQAFAQRWGAEHAAQSEATLRVIGFCLLARRTVIDTIGGWDTRFGNGNFEDDDLCRRATYLGFDARVVQDVFIHHVGGQTFIHAKIDYGAAMERNWAIFKAKWGIPPERTMQEGYILGDTPPASALRRIGLPELGQDHEPEMDQRWWRPREASLSSEA